MVRTQPGVEMVALLTWQGCDVTAEVVVIGSANADVVVRVDRRPGPGETVLGSRTVLGDGGKGANAAIAAALQGGRVALLGAVAATSTASCCVAR